MKRKLLWLIVAALALSASYPLIRQSELGSCVAYALGGPRHIADDRTERFLGKAKEDTARCRGGASAVAWSKTPWVDWQKYWAAGDAGSVAPGLTGKLGFFSSNQRGIDGALLDLEYQRVELLKYNLLDNGGTYEQYISGKDGADGRSLKIWDQMRLPKDHPYYKDVGGAGPQRCSGALVRFRNLTGICNDVINPLMGSTDQPFARNVEFDATFPDLEKNEITRNRHGDRLSLLQPDPQVISRKLFTRIQTDPSKCNEGRGLPDYSPAANCDYQKAPHLNVLAAFWIQFMTHDWFSHLEEGKNGSELMAMGCSMQRIHNIERPLTANDVTRLGCRPDDRIDKGIIAEDTPPPTFTYKNEQYLTRARKTTPNKVTAWWDGSQIYGYSEISRRRVKRDPRDPAKLLLEPVGSGAAETTRYLPILQASDPMNPQWSGQEAVAFPDNWTIGLSFFHNVFAREHNFFVDAFRKQAAAAPQGDCGLRDPARPGVVIRYEDVTADELFEVARLVVSAEIAKIHTIEWTTQLLYNEPFYLAMNANWNGLFGNHPLVTRALKNVIDKLTKSESANNNSQWYSVFASGPGIFGLGNDKPDINGGVNHFGSPFNFPEEFITVYRLHPMVPDLIEFREINNPNLIKYKIPVVGTLRGKATQAMQHYGLANWALSMGRQRAGQLTLQNHPRFLQNLNLPRLNTATGKIDVSALDLIRDRERGVPRYNEFRRQYGLTQLTSFDDFIDPDASSSQRVKQQKIAAILREVYGQHTCDAAKIITTAQVNGDGTSINDCLGHPNGTRVDNIEDVDTVAGWLAEFARPHGFAISETQLQVFILNASRRLFSDRFLTSSFRPEFYTQLGVRWVNENGPDGKLIESRTSNDHKIEVSPLKRVLQRTIPELKPELKNVINVFDPWARDRGEYYSLQWKPRPGAETDEAFKTQ